jgi:hypothetical protein
MSAAVVVKVCSCKRTFTKAEWLELPFRGFVDDDAPADPDHPEFGEPLGVCEMRNCDCGSSIMVACSTLEAV